MSLKQSFVLFLPWFRLSIKINDDDCQQSEQEMCGWYDCKHGVPPQTDSAHCKCQRLTDERDQKHIGPISLMGWCWFEGLHSEPVKDVVGEDGSPNTRHCTQAVNDCQCDLELLSKNWKHCCSLFLGLKITEIKIYKTQQVLFIIVLI